MKVQTSIETAIIPSRKFIYSIYADHTWAIWECIFSDPSFVRGAEVAKSKGRHQCHLNARRAVAKAIARLEKIKK